MLLQLNQSHLVSPIITVSGIAKVRGRAGFRRGNHPSPAEASRSYSDVMVFHCYRQTWRVSLEAGVAFPTESFIDPLQNDATGYEGKESRHVTVSPSPYPHFP